jgi:hypothetical protein
MKVFKDLTWGKILLALFASLIVGAFLWSIGFESLLPLWLAGDMQMLTRNLFGIPIIFIGLGLFIWGALRFITATYTAMNAPELRDRVKIIRSNAPKESISQARKENFSALIRAWKPALLIMLAGFILIAFGGWLIN